MYKLSYYEKLLEDLQQMEKQIDCSFPKLKDEIKSLNFEVRYIMPYMTCNRITSHEAYEETKRVFSIEGHPKRLIKFVEYMIERALIDQPNATKFYHDTRVGDCNWDAFTDCVLNNLMYAQSFDCNKDAAKSIEESLRFVRNFVILVKKWNFGKLNNMDTKIRDIHYSMVNVSRDAALIHHLFMVEKFDGLNEAMNLRISEVQEKSNGAFLEAKEAYYDILSLLKLCAPDSCPVKIDTLYGLIDSLQKDLMEVLNVTLVKLSREQAIRDMINEMEFLKNILSCSSDGLIDRGKLKAVATHVDVLACEAGSAVYASAAELEGLNDKKRHTKVTSSVAKINQTMHELRQTNKKDEMKVHCLIEDFIKDECFRTRRNGTCNNSESITLELDFYQTFFSCTEKWCIDHPHLQAMRNHTENIVRCAGWDVQSLSFRKNITGKKVTGEKIEFILSDMVQKLTLHRPDFEEICTKIRDLEPSSQSRLSKKFGLVFADILLSNMQTCENKLIFQISRHLHWIAGNMLLGSKSVDGLSTFLEDLIDRATCLSYLKLVDKADKTASLKVLLDRIEEPLLVNNFKTLLDCTGWNIRYSVVARHLRTRVPINTLQLFIKGCLGTDASFAAIMKDPIESVLSDLTVLRCILIDPVMEYYEQQEYDEVLTDIGEAIIEAGVFFFFRLVGQSEDNIPFRVMDVARCLSAIVKQVYFKYTKLSLSKLPTTEIGSLNILLANLKKMMNKCRQIPELHEDLQVCNSFLEDPDISSNQDKLGMIKGLRIRILHLGCKLVNTLGTFDEVTDWFFDMRISSFTEGVKVIVEDIEDTKLQLLAEVDSSNQMR